MVRGRLALLVLLALGVAASAACFRPNIKEGGLVCADGGVGGVCPEGFECSQVDNHCYTPDAGPPCPANMLHVTPVCTDPPASGSACNPACQNGCACGRCTVMGTTAQCVAAGTKTDGQVCNVASDDCGAGLSCVKDNCGTNLGRCRKFCRTDQDCSAGVLCTTPKGPAKVCDDVSFQACDPVALTGCPDPALFCYIRGTQPACECPGTVPDGMGCASDTSCQPGSRCVGSMTQPAVCVKVCRSRPAVDTCPAPTTCQAITEFGFCQ
jgi:hypothetical protein